MAKKTDHVVLKEPCPKCGCLSATIHYHKEQP